MTFCSPSCLNVHNDKGNEALNERKRLEEEQVLAEKQRIEIEQKRRKQAREDARTPILAVCVSCACGRHMPAERDGRRRPCATFGEMMKQPHGAEDKVQLKTVSSGAIDMHTKVCVNIWSYHLSTP